MAIIQVRIDDRVKINSQEILEELGLDLSTAIRMFLKKVIVTKGIPFDTFINDVDLKGKMAWMEMARISKANGNSEMTLEEINEIIREVREERRNKK